ncbi:hypothetical protein RB195_024564 [Necator americanus]|uniref:Uncharacterized protein n=1 Tax=Necator americanus TaxID=51031 RepID=A0ABR1ENT8_NECAM
MASLAFTTSRRPTNMDQGATLRHFAKTMVSLGSGLLLARLPIPRSRNGGCVELLLCLGDPAGERTSAVHRSSTSRVTSTHYETVNRCGGAASLPIHKSPYHDLRRFGQR